MSKLEQDEIVLLATAFLVLSIGLVSLVVVYLAEKSESQHFQEKYEDTWRKYVRATTK